jgi:hypothetical protein
MHLRARGLDHRQEAVGGDACENTSKDEFCVGRKRKQVKRFCFLVVLIIKVQYMPTKFPFKYMSKVEGPRKLELERRRAERKNLLPLFKLRNLRAPASQLSQCCIEVALVNHATGR